MITRDASLIAMVVVLVIIHGTTSCLKHASQVDGADRANRNDVSSCIAVETSSGGGRDSL